MRKRSVLTLFLFVLCLVSRLSFADTLVNLKLESTGNVPYQFSINGSSTYVNLTCLNPNRSVHQFESWTADAVNLSTLIGSGDPTSVGGISLADLKLDAFLFTQYNANLTSTHNQEVQDAIWSILVNPNLNNFNNDRYDGLTTQAQKTAVDNLIMLAQTTNENLTFYSQFTFYYPTSWGQRDSIPQQFLGYSPAATPEPSSLILLGTGLTGLAGAMRRRVKGSRKAAQV